MCLDTDAACRYRAVALLSFHNSPAPAAIQRLKRDPVPVLDSLGPWSRECGHEYRASACYSHWVERPDFDFKCELTLNPKNPFYDL